MNEKIIHCEKNNSRPAKLRIFLGMSAGVGKTYSMLKAAQQNLKEGTDVVLGIVQTHGQAETEELILGLPAILLKKSTFRGLTTEEMDLDAILERKPKIAIVDDLAHSNAPGSRHKKRYQDVIELLDAGIDVFTTLNVQHLESRKDSIEAITSTPIQETVPDSILERATVVELIDIAPTEVLKRLKEGKVALGEGVQHLTENFFKEDRLTALREIALRITADLVDHDLQKLSGFKEDASPWQTNERLLVAISHSPFSEKLIRATRRLAYRLESPWIVLHVDTGLVLKDTDQAQLMKNLNLARELNAEVITTTEVDVPSAVRRICRNKNVTQVLVGRPKSHWLRSLLEGGSLLTRLVRENLDVDVHVIRQETKSSYQPNFMQTLSKYKSKSGVIKYWFAFCFMLGTAFLSQLILPVIGYRAVGFIFLLAVLVAGMFGSIGAVIFSASMSALLWNFLFIPPRFTFAITAADDIILCISFFVVALITGFLANRIRFHERLIRDREEKTNFLYEILQDISNSNEKSEFLKKVTHRVGRFLNADCKVLLKSKNGDLVFEDSNGAAFLNDKDRVVALWTFQNQKHAGWSTPTLSQSHALYIPLKGYNENVGVFVFHPFKKFRKLDVEQENLLFSITRQLGISIERHFLSKRLIDAEKLKASEGLHQTILNSISHEMRTPLTAMLGTAAALEKENISKDPMMVRQISQSLQEAGERLNRVIENLLDMSRLNSGVLALNLEWHDINDLIGVVTQKATKSSGKHKIKVTGLEDATLVKMDFRLMEHAISNILVNASNYSPPGSNIRISAKKDSENIVLEIEDDGPGIGAQFIPKIFDKFYRAPGTPTGGTGLGLSIVKSIVELHQGRVSFYQPAICGAGFRIELPLQKSPSLPKENP